MAPAIAPDAKIPHLQAELEDLTYALAPEEKEDTWEKFEKAIIRFAAVTRGGGYKHLEMYIEGVGRKGVGPKLAKCMLSDRGRLSGVSTDLLQTFAPRLSNNFKPLVNLYLEPLIDLLGRPNKVFLKRAEKCFITIITHCHLFAILPEMKRGLSDNATSCRRGCGIGIERAMKEWEKETFGEKGATMLEDCVKKMATDKDPEVRQTGRRVWAKFQEIWPERVDEFSAPLTPTIRRYLEMPPANGAGPSKPKAASRPVAPSLRSVSATSSTSSLGSAAARPQNNRVQALNSRPQRPTAPPATRTAPAEPGPSRRTSPRKEPEPLSAHEEEEADQLPATQPVLSRSVSSGPGRHFDVAGLGALGRHGRSVSHNILPSTNIFAQPGDHESGKYNPLSKPVRPTLSNALSTMSLPADPSETAPPPRRFAPPARIVRIIQPSDDDGAIDPPYGEHPIVTPSGTTVLRGAVRTAHAGIGRRPPPLGHAHRRVVTAPVGTIAEDENASKTPAWTGKMLAKDDAEVQDTGKTTPVETVKRAAPREHVAASAPEPFTSPAPAQTAHVDSPLMPVLIRSTSGDVKADEEEEKSDDLINMKEEVYPASPLKGLETEESRKIVEMAAKVELPGSPVRESAKLALEPGVADAEDGQTRTVAEIKQDEKEELAVGNGDVHTAVLEKQEEAPPEPRRTESERPSETLPATSEAATDIQPTSSLNDGTVNVSSITTAAVVMPPAEPIAVNKLAPSRPKVVSSNSSATIKPKQPPVTRKPPVPPARTARTVSAPISRKPFKPTSLTASTAASAARAVSVSKPAPASTVVSKPTVATSTTAKVSTLSSSTSSKPLAAVSTATKQGSVAPTKPPVPSVKTTKPEPKPVAKPAVPAVTRAAPIRVVSAARKPTVTSQVPLPPAKKEKIRLKAPLPSFRPQSSKARAVSASAAPSSLQASTSSSTSSGRARVRPEMIKLPESPARVKPSEIPLPTSPGDVPLPPTPRSKVSTLANSAHKPSPLKVELSRARAASTASAPQSPITVAPPKPLSPLLTTDTTHLPQAPSFAPAKMVTEETYLNGMGLPSTSSDPFGSVSARSGASKASTLPATSELGDETLDTTDDEMEGVVFNQRSATRPPVHTKASSAQVANETGDLIELSAPSRQINAFAPRTDVSTPHKSAAMLLAKLDGVTATPGMTGTERKVLSVRDPNTPGWMDEDVSI
nr:uncharacterized protein CI109_004443 [Kwoniella shandongensis]KAA5527151.1 hypothetical protein CI109_004443 [Kwoniella shandongensis]